MIPKEIYLIQRKINLTLILKNKGYLILLEFYLFLFYAGINHPFESYFFNDNVIIKVNSYNYFKCYINFNF